LENTPRYNSITEKTPALTNIWLRFLGESELPDPLFTDKAEQENKHIAQK